MKQYNTIIIGGGVIGNSIAYHLSEKSKERVAVIERDFPLSGTSGATQAWIWVHTKRPASYAYFNKLSSDMYPSLQKEIGDFEYRQQGGIEPFFDEEARLQAIKLAEEQKKWGIPVQVLTRKEVLAKEPEISQNVIGATYSPIDGSVHPFRLVERYMKAAKANGVDYFFYNKVIRSEQKHEGYLLETNKGERLFAHHVVIASGTWSKEAGELFDVHIPVRPVRGQVLVTEQLKPLFSHILMGMRQLKNGEVLVDFTEEEAGFNKRTTFETLEATAKRAVTILPALQDALVIRNFSGLRAIPEDGMPMIGKIPGKDNLFVACMHSGMTLSPLVGSILSDLIVHQKSEVDYSDYLLDRFIPHKE